MEIEIHRPIVSVNHSTGGRGMGPGTTTIHLGQGPHPQDDMIIRSFHLPLNEDIKLGHVCSITIEIDTEADREIPDGPMDHGLGEVAEFMP